VQPPDGLAADLAAMGPWNYLFLASCTAEVAHNAGQLTDLEHAQLQILDTHLLGAARGASEETLIELDADDLGIELRAVRDTFARAQKQQGRLGRRQGPNRRPAARRESRRRRNVRTRRAKARSPGSSSDDGPSEGESGPAAHSREPLDLLDIAVLALGWGRV